MARIANSPLSSMFSNFNGNPDDDELKKKVATDNLLSFDVPSAGQSRIAPTNTSSINTGQGLKQDDPSNPDGPSTPDEGKNQAQQKAECTANGGKWITTDTYGSGYCDKSQSSSNIPQQCPDGQEFSTIGPNGEDDNTGSCVTHAEADRRWELFKNRPRANQNNATPSDGGGGGKGGGSGIDPMLWDSIFKDLFAKFGKVKLPYDDAAIAELEGKLKASSAAEAAQNNRSLMASRATMGLGNTGRTAQGIRNNISAANQKYDTGMIDINDNARRANFQAEMNRLTSQLSTLDSQANLVIGLTNSATQRMQVQNTYAIQRAQLVQQMEELKLKLAWGAL